jgi:tRNA(fMet)-specific endonuclease VapC
MPVTGRVLLDTNILIALLAADGPVVERVRAVEAVYVPVVALGELYYGARKSARMAENLARIAEFAKAAAVLVCDAETAARYGEVKAALRALGKPIPENDVWIAAVAWQHELVLVSRDEHFGHVPGLAIERWEG